MTSTISIDASVLSNYTISGLSNYTTSAASYGSFTTSYVQPDYSIKNPSGNEVLRVPDSDTPTLEVTGNVRINGEDLNERLERIETLLNIPTRNVTIEAQYPKLKKLYEEYMAELEKYKTWNRLTKGTEQ